jgi:hypothetical protein
MIVMQQHKTFQWDPARPNFDYEEGRTSISVKSLPAKIARKLLRNRDRVAGFWCDRFVPAIPSLPPKIHSHFIRTV